MQAAYPDMPQPPRGMSPDYTVLKADLAPSLCSNASKLKGVCAQLVQYDQVVSVPPRRCEVKMLQASLYAIVTIN